MKYKLLNKVMLAVILSFSFSAQGLQDAGSGTDHSDTGTVPLLNSRAVNAQDLAAIREIEQGLLRAIMSVFCCSS